MYRNVAGADLFASPAFDAQFSLLRDIYTREPFTACSQPQKPHGAEENLRLLFIGGTHSHTAEALNAVVESHEPVDLAHGDSTETFAFVACAASFIDGRQTLRYTPVNPASVNDEVFHHRKVLERLQGEVPGHRDRAGKARFSIDHHGAFPAVASFAIEAEGKTWIELPVNIEQTSKDLIPGRVGNRVGPGSRLLCPLRIPAQNVNARFHVSFLPARKYALLFRLPGLCSK